MALIASANVDIDEDEEVTGYVGNYKVWYRPLLAHGGFGTVHNAQHKVTDETVVGKNISLLDGAGVNYVRKKMADNELGILMSLQTHTNIVKMISYELRRDSLWIFMEYCIKGHLINYLNDNPCISVFRRTVIMSEIISAIAFMHSQNPPIIHRDLKPQNILLQQEGTADVVKVTDLGFSKFVEESDSLSKRFYPKKCMETTCGSRYFMAPEFFAELKGGTKYDESVDVFAIGLVMKVLIEYLPNNREELPLSVQSRQAKIVVAYGAELVDKFRSKETMPTLFNDGDEADETTRRLRRIIKYMTAFEPRRRKYIIEVKEEIVEILQKQTGQTTLQYRMALTPADKMTQIYGGSAVPKTTLIKDTNAGAVSRSRTDDCELERARRLDVTEKNYGRCGVSKTSLKKENGVGAAAKANAEQMKIGFPVPQTYGIGAVTKTVLKRDTTDQAVAKSRTADDEVESVTGNAEAIKTNLTRGISTQDLTALFESATDSPKPTYGGAELPNAHLQNYSGVTYVANAGNDDGDIERVGGNAEPRKTNGIYAATPFKRCPAGVRDAPPIIRNKLAPSCAKFSIRRGGVSKTTLKKDTGVGAAAKANAEQMKIGFPVPHTYGIEAVTKTVLKRDRNDQAVTKSRTADDEVETVRGHAEAIKTNLTRGNSVQDLTTLFESATDSPKPTYGGAAIPNAHLQNYSGVTYVANAGNDDGDLERFGGNAESKKTNGIYAATPFKRCSAGEIGFPVPQTYGIGEATKTVLKRDTNDQVVAKSRRADDEVDSVRGNAKAIKTNLTRGISMKDLTAILKSATDSPKPTYGGAALPNAHLQNYSGVTYVANASNDDGDIKRVGGNAELKKSSKLDLLRLKNDTLFEDRRVVLKYWPESLCFGHGQLYSCEWGNRIFALSLDLEKFGYVTEWSSEQGGMYGAAETGENTLVVAGSIGLFAITRTGEVQQELSKGWHTDVCLGSDGRLYTVVYNSSINDIQGYIYKRDGETWVKIKQFKVPCTGPSCWFSLAQINCFIYTACSEHNCVYKLNICQDGAEWIEDQAYNYHYKPCVSAADEHENVLITETCNNRLVIISADSRLTELRTEPQINKPSRAVIAG